MTAGRWEIVGHTFVVIGLAVVVQIMQSRDLIRTQHENLFVLNDDSESLIASRRDTLPAKRLVELLRDPADNPHFAHQRRHDDSPIFQTTHPTDSHGRSKRIGLNVRQRDAVDREGRSIVTFRAASFDDAIHPLPGGSFAEVGRRWKFCDSGDHIVQSLIRRQTEGDSNRFVGRIVELQDGIAITFGQFNAGRGQQLCRRRLARVNDVPLGRPPSTNNVRIKTPSTTDIESRTVALPICVLKATCFPNR